jgi:hypothetical protein
VTGYYDIMAIICYNGKFVITATSLETNVAVVMRADCNSIEKNPKSSHDNK